jgi:hypothetical protein
MARFAIALVAALGLVVSACGKDEDKSKPAPSVPYASTPPSGKTAPGEAPGGKATPPAAVTSWTGTVQPAGVGITMQGSHKLVEGGTTVVLLTTTNRYVELVKFEGKRVKVTGTPSPTVEGGQTIVDVQTIVEAP